MSSNPLAPVVDYPSMLNRIFWFTTAAALVATWLLRLHISELNLPLSQVDFALAFAGDKVVPVPGGYLFPALAVGMLTRVFRLHARVSDWFGIRECFDVDVIIAELARQSAIDLDRLQHDELVSHRHSIMRRAFYPFVSGPRPTIDQGLIEQALDAWSWLWVGIETTLVFLLTAFALIAAGAYEIGFQTLAGTLAVAALGLPALRRQCQRYAIAQVRAILDEPSRAAAVRNVFGELHGDNSTRRAAA